MESTNIQSLAPATGNKARTLRTQTYELLRNAILDGHLETGKKLVERELCELSGASRSIMREALVELEGNGLIENISYRGYSVTRLSVRKVYEIFELRAVLETQAAELFTERASPEEIEALQQAHNDLERCVENFNLEQMRATKERYYEVLFTGCRNEEIRRALSNIINRVYYLRSWSMMNPARREASIGEMRRLTAALVAHDRVAAREASLAHLEAARNAILKAKAEADPETESSRRPAEAKQQ